MVVADLHRTACAIEHTQSPDLTLKKRGTSHSPSKHMLVSLLILPNDDELFALIVFICRLRLRSR
jgi:hypothetical protein